MGKLGAKARMKKKMIPAQRTQVARIAAAASAAVRSKKARAKNFGNGLG